MTEQESIDRLKELTYEEYLELYNNCDTVQYEVLSKINFKRSKQQIIDFLTLKQNLKNNS